MADYDYSGLPISNVGPPSKFISITKSDVTDLTSARIRALWIGTAGDVAVLGYNDVNPVTLKNVANGTLIVGMVKKVMSTGTTASDIVGMS